MYFAEMPSLVSLSLRYRRYHINVLTDITTFSRANFIIS